jgi:hypothetical protein
LRLLLSVLPAAVLSLRQKLLLLLLAESAAGFSTVDTGSVRCVSPRFVFLVCVLVLSVLGGLLSIVGSWH